MCDDQLAQLATCGPEIQVCHAEMKGVAHGIKAHKSALEKLMVAKRQLKKEQDERMAQGKRNERAEEGCRWCVFLFVATHARR